jgi:hypothetical protein
VIRKRQVLPLLSPKRFQFVRQPPQKIMKTNQPSKNRLNLKAS